MYTQDLIIIDQINVKWKFTSLLERNEHSLVKGKMELPRLR